MTQRNKALKVFTVNIVWKNEKNGKSEQEGHDGHVCLHWLIHEIPSYQMIQYMGIGLKHKTPNKD